MTMNKGQAPRLSKQVSSLGGVEFSYLAKNFDTKFVSATLMHATINDSFDLGSEAAGSSSRQTSLVQKTFIQNLH